MTDKSNTISWILFQLKDHKKLQFDSVGLDFQNNVFLKTMVTFLSLFVAVIPIIAIKTCYAIVLELDFDNAGVSLDFT